MDFLYPNIRKPQKFDVRIIKVLQDEGFVYLEDSLTGVGKFFKEDLLELEFLTRSLGKGENIKRIGGGGQV